VAVAGFTVASMLCGMAQSLEQIVLFRILQGMFGAALVPLSQSVLLDVYPKERRDFAMALWGIAVMVGPVLGPVLGGWLTESYTWRWVFYINLPIGALTLLGITTFLPETGRKAGEKLDWFGFGTLSLAIGALQVLLDRGEQLDWFASGEIWIEAILAAAAFYLFSRPYLHRGQAVVRPALFRDRNFAAGTLFHLHRRNHVSRLAGAAHAYLQNLMNYPIVTAGLVMGPRGIGTMGANADRRRWRTGRTPRPARRWSRASRLGPLYEMTGWTPDVSQTTISMAPSCQFPRPHHEPRGDDRVVHEILEIGR